MLNLSFDFSTFKHDEKELSRYEQYLEDNNVPDPEEQKIIEDFDLFISKAEELLSDPRLSTEGTTRQWSGKAKDPKAMISFINQTFKCNVTWCQRSVIGVNYGLFKDTNIGADIGNDPIRRVHFYILINKEHNKMYTLDEVINEHTVFVIEDSY